MYLCVFVIHAACRTLQRASTAESLRSLADKSNTVSRSKFIVEPAEDDDDDNDEDALLLKSATSTAEKAAAIAATP